VTSAVLTFPSNENPLTNGGAGPGTLTNTVSATWTNPVTAVAGSPGIAKGIGSSGTNDAVARFNGPYGLIQIVKGTISRTGTPGAAEVELHGFMTTTPAAGGNPDGIWTIEDDLTATVANIVTWLFNQGSFNVFGGGTITELIDGDVITVVHSWFYKRIVVEMFINGVLVFTATDTSGVVPATGNPGIGFDDQGVGGLFVFKGFSAFSPTPNNFSGFPKRMLAGKFEGVQA